MNFTFESLFVFAIVLVIAIIIMATLFKKTPRKMDTAYFQKGWQDLQRLCVNKDTWPLAVMNADKLLDQALIRRKFSGKTMGERLVSAQRVLSDNDGVWYAHKLRNKLAHENNFKLRQGDVKQALVSFRQALKDLGAL